MDELQDADPAGLRTVAYAWQELQGTRIPAALIAAGLSNTPDKITAAVTSAERFQFRPMRDLADHEVREALTEPAADLGVRWETPALQAVVAKSEGYPYAVQLWGDAMWRAAGSPDRDGVLASAHVPAAQEMVAIDLEALHRARWSKASGQERRFLLAMADGGGRDVSRAWIAEHLGVGSRALSPTRQSLLDKGILQSTGHGLLSFTVPGFADFVRDLRE